MACHNGHQDVVEYLVSNGADVNCQNCDVSGVKADTKGCPIVQLFLNNHRDLPH